MEENNKENIDLNAEKNAEQIDSDVLDDSVMELPMIPLRGLSIFPNMVLHFDIGREKSINALERQWC